MPTLNIKPVLQESTGTGKVYKIKPVDNNNPVSSGCNIAINISGSGYGTLKAFDGDKELDVTFVREIVVQSPYSVTGEFTAVVPLNKEIHFEYTPAYSLDGDPQINAEKVEVTFEDNKALFSYIFTIGGLLYISDFNFE